MAKYLYLGCTLARHKQIGIDAVINARGGLQHLNDRSIEEIKLMRDGIKIKQKKEFRVAIHQFNSKFCRRNQSKLNHLISDWS